MPMTDQELNKILQIGKVDVGNGTLFGKAVKKKVDTSHLTLVISTGGSGMSSIRAAMSTARQKLDPGYSNYVKFIVVDSDTGEVNRVQNEGIDNINISCNGVQARLERRNRSEFYKSFVPENYDIGILNPDGASQDRMTGKIKLYDRNSNGTTNDATLRDKISRLFREDWMAHRNLALDVMILTGISGGNGSGTFMDIAAIVRKACQGGLNGTLSIYGYILLPDTADGFASDDNARSSLRGNGFAALKELESYWGITSEPYRREIFLAPSSASSQVLTSTSKLFDHVFLISGDYQKAVSMVAETIVNTIADSGGTFNQASFISNESTAIANKRSKEVILDTGIIRNMYPEDSFHYLGLGYAQASIPETVVIPNVVSHVCRALYEPDTGIQNIGAQQQKTVFAKGDRKLTKIEFNKAIGKLLNLPANASPNENNLWQKVFKELEKRTAVPDNPVELTVKDVQAGQTQQFFAAYQVTKVTNIALNGFVDTALPKLLQDLFERAKSVMKVYGPRAIECLFDGVGNPDEKGVPESFKDICLRRQMEVVSEKFAQMANAPGKFPVGLQKQSLDPLKSKALAVFKGDAKDAAVRMVRCNVAGAMTGMQGGWQTEFVSKAETLRNKCEMFARVLEKVADYYTGAGSSLDADNFEKFAKTSGGANDINLCQDPKIYNWVRNTVGRKVSSIAVGKAEEIRAALVDDFYENEEEWLSTEEGKARRAFDNCLAKICKLGIHSGAADGMRLGITDYFNEVLSGLSDGEQAAAINLNMRNIVGRLTTGSEASLKTKNHAEAANVNEIILIPQSLTVGTQGGFISNALNSLVGAGNYHSSAVVESIVCYQTSAGNGISELQDLNLWEDAYEASFDSSIHLNNGEYFELHLETGYSQYRELTKTQTDEKRGIKSKWPISPEDDKLFGTGLAWEHYPSPNYSRYGSEFGSNVSTREAVYRREVFDKRVEKAIELGIIEVEKEKNTQKWFLNTLPMDWDNFDLRRYNDNNGAQYLRGRQLFEFFREQNTTGNPSFRKQIMIVDSPAFGPDGFDFTQIVARERWTEERIDRESRLYMKRILRKATEMYQELEDTLYRFYDIEMELRQKDEELVHRFRAKVFADLFIKGVVNYDDPEELFEWTVATNERRGSLESEDVMNFGRSAKVRMSDIDKKLTNDGMRLAVVYRKVCEMADDKKLDLMKLKEFSNVHFDNLSAKEQEKMLDERLAVMEDSKKAFDNIVGKSKDREGAILEAFEMDDDALEQVSKVVEFYDAIRKALKDYS